MITPVPVLDLAKYDYLDEATRLRLKEIAWVQMKLETRLLFSKLRAATAKLER